MKKKQSFVVTLLMLASMFYPSVSFAEKVERDDVRIRIFQKNDLPIGGSFVLHPKFKQVAYYYLTTIRLRQDKNNANKLSGLYISTDAGLNWKFMTNHFEFKSLFIHPDSGELFAIIQDNIIAPGEDGFLATHLLDKAVMSKDGVKWKDIMGKQQRASMLSKIFVDPEHPNRVRLIGHAFRPYTLVAIDDNYSDWKRVNFTGGSIF